MPYEQKQDALLDMCQHCREQLFSLKMAGSIVWDVSLEMIVDFNHLISEQPDDFDYKRDLKSPEKTKGWRGELLRTYTKDLKRKKATDLASGLK